jgi:hypothetical protein
MPNVRPRQRRRDHLLDHSLLAWRVMLEDQWGWRECLRRPPDDPIHRLLVHGTPPDVSRPRESQGHAPIMRATAQG